MTPPSIDWIGVQEAVTRHGDESPEAAAAMRRYRVALTPAHDHRTPGEVWQPAGRATGGWERVNAPRQRPHGQHFDPRVDFPERYSEGPY